MDRYFRYAAMVDFVEENESVNDIQRVERDSVSFLTSGVESDPFFKMSNAEFFEEFRFSKLNAIRLINELMSYMSRHSNRRDSIPTHLRILTCLQWLGTGNFIWNLRNIAGSSKATAWRCVWETISAISSNHMIQKWLPWPVGDAPKAHTDYFNTKYRLPNILGVVDGTHIPTNSPASDSHESVYVNRKHFHSINVQIVCGADLKIIHVDISNVGSAHDARVWDESDVPRLIQEAKLSLLGDSTYPCRWFIITPYNSRMRNNLNRRQQILQGRLLAARQNVEQVIGILKQRFNVLQSPARYTLNKLPIVVISCCVLHNICRHFCIPSIDHIEAIDNLLEEYTPNDDAVGNVGTGKTILTDLSIDQ